MPNIIAFVMVCSYVTKTCNWVDVPLAFRTIGECNYYVANKITDYARASSGKFIARHVCAEPTDDSPE